MVQTPLVLLRKTDLGTFEMQKFDGILDNCPDELYQEFLDFIPDLNSKSKLARFVYGKFPLNFFVANSMCF